MSVLARKARTVHRRRAASCAWAGVGGSPPAATDNAKAPSEACCSGAKPGPLLLVRRPPHAATQQGASAAAARPPSQPAEQQVRAATSDRLLTSAGRPPHSEAVAAVAAAGRPPQPSLAADPRPPAPHSEAVAAVAAASGQPFQCRLAFRRPRPLNAASHGAAGFKRPASLLGDEDSAGPPRSASKMQSHAEPHDQGAAGEATRVAGGGDAAATEAVQNCGADLGGREADGGVAGSESRIPDVDVVRPEISRTSAGDAAGDAAGWGTGEGGGSPTACDLEFGTADGAAPQSCSSERQADRAAEATVPLTSMSKRRRATKADDELRTPLARLDGAQLDGQRRPRRPVRAEQGARSLFGSH
jgi:hypothetical protein